MPTTTFAKHNSQAQDDDIPDGVDPVLWTKDYINEEHLAAFKHALELPDTSAFDGANTPAVQKSPVFSPVEGGPEWSPNIEKLTATSDFATGHSLGLTYHLIRWPLLGFLFLIISIEFGLYVGTRQIVNVFEYFLAWRGQKGSLRKKLRAATTYPEWKQAAREMDTYLGFDEWKQSEDDSYFDYNLVRRVRHTLARFRTNKDTRGLMDALAVCVRPNFAGTESVKMYSETFFGTKRVIEAHVNEVAESLDFVRRATDVSLEEKRAFFRAINNNYGSSALCLSGGASFGYYHFGVLKAFLDTDLLPRVITGTSAGGLIAALACTHTDAELKQLIRPELARKLCAFDDPPLASLKRWWDTGARYSAYDWARKAMFFTRGSLTFKEAYELTGRALNVTVVPSDRHSPTILLNHLTAPNCIIWSAIIASAAVPGILNPVVLMAKDRNGQILPHNLGGSRFKDGSLREDIPLGSLHTQFNCNFSIVSQTNPHIHLFFFAPRGSVGRPVAHRKGRGWRGGFILSALESYIKLDLSKHFKVIRDLDLMPQILQSDWSGVFLQRFSGDLTITPRTTLRDWFNLLSDPDEHYFKRMLAVSQRTSWPSLHMVENRTKIERAIFRGRAEVRLALHRDRPTTDRNEASRTNSLAAPVPIESDADAAIAFRARRHRAELTPEAASALRRRRGLRRGEFPDHLAPPTNNTLHATPPPSEPQPPSPTIPRTFSTTIGDTFRNMRTPSISGFSSSLRNRYPDHTTPNTRSSSRLGIARWFSTTGSDSDDEEDDVNAPSPIPNFELDTYDGDDIFVSSSADEGVPSSDTAPGSDEAHQDAA
ncbi:Patatin-like phospholipase domain-containing protein [Vanrija pseudolonga]|uniref:Patatin-like phospholipase domain-containing protein n=1 Tax=Vanrija pseudolonga TaxID=143232 RepID=A0AAF1BF53_9TREE|nr:Patatin-like phospholipase domain-containing protein [Vanrija pseudolonga]